MGAAPRGPARGSYSQWARSPAGSPRSPGQQRRRRCPIGAAQLRGRVLPGRGVAPPAAPGAACPPRGLRVPRPALPSPPGADPRGDTAGMGSGDVFTKTSVFPQRVAPSRASPSERPGDCCGPGLCPEDREQWVSREPGGAAGQGSSAAFRVILGVSACQTRAQAPDEPRGVWVLPRVWMSGSPGTSGRLNRGSSGLLSGAGTSSGRCLRVQSGTGVPGCLSEGTGCHRGFCAARVGVLGSAGLSCRQHRGIRVPGYQGVAGRAMSSGGVPGSTGVPGRAG